MDTCCTGLAMELPPQRQSSSSRGAQEHSIKLSCPQTASAPSPLQLHVFTSLQEPSRPQSPSPRGQEEKRGSGAVAFRPGLKVMPWRRVPGKQQGTLKPLGAAQHLCKARQCRAGCEESEWSVPFRAARAAQETQAPGGFGCILMSSKIAFRSSSPNWFHYLPLWSCLLFACSNTPAVMCCAAPSPQ